MDDKETDIGLCFTIIRHTSEFPKLVRLKIGFLLSDENDLAKKFIDAMKRGASLNLLHSNDDLRETVRLFHLMLLDEKDELKREEEEEDTQLKGDDDDDDDDDDNKMLANKQEKTVVDDDRTSSPPLSRYVRKLYSILNNDGMEIPVCVRNAIEYDQELKCLAILNFYTIVAGCVHDLFYKHDDEFFPCHLDSNRDTEKEIEFAINFFPFLLEQRNGIKIGRLLGDSATIDYAVTRAAMNTDTNQRYCNIKSVLFVPILAELGLQKRTGESSVDRGGLLSYNKNDMNTLRYLATSGSCRCCSSSSSSSSSRDNNTTNSESDNNNNKQDFNNQSLVMTSNTTTTQSSDYETNNKTDDYYSYSSEEEDYIKHQIHVDETNLLVIKKLRERNLFYKEDIQREDLMECLLLCCCNNNIDDDDDGKDDDDDSGGAGSSNSSFYFAEKRFRYLVDWDPISLTMERDNRSDGILPLHLSVMNTFNIHKNNKNNNNNNNNIRHVAAAISGLRGFRTVLDAGIRHYPIKVGFLFHKDINNDRTPFQMACDKYGKEAVMQIVDDVVIIGNINSTTTTTTTTAAANTTTITFIETLITAAVDETIHLDCIFFLLRKEPSVLLQTSSSVSSNEDGDKCNPMRMTKMAMITKNQQKRKREIISSKSGSKEDDSNNNDEHGHGDGGGNHKGKTQICT